MSTDELPAAGHSAGPQPLTYFPASRPAPQELPEADVAAAAFLRRPLAEGYPASRLDYFPKRRSAIRFVRARCIFKVREHIPGRENRDDMSRKHIFAYG